MPLTEFSDATANTCTRKPMPPCKSCPWRKDARASDIPNFSLPLAESLSSCSPDANGIGPHFGATKMACHQSKEGDEFVCAGWLATVGHAHTGVRLSLRAGKINPDALAPGEDWPDLHETYPEVLAKLRDTLEPEGETGS